MATQDPRVKVVQLRRNFGQTPAIAAGIDYAHGEVLVFLDADLQNDPADIPRLIATLGEGYDVVSGWRQERQDALLTRKLPSWIANWLISAIMGVKLRDYGCSLKVYRRGGAGTGEPLRRDASVYPRLRLLGRRRHNGSPRSDITPGRAASRSTGFRELSKCSWTC